MDELRALLNRCVKCGQCRSVCPVFKSVNRETAVARGKMALLQAALDAPGGLGPRLASSLSLCLLCGTCTASCPNEAQAHEAIRRARATLARDGGLPLPKRILSRWMARDRRSRDRLLRGASALQGIVAAELPEDRGLRLRLPLRRFQMEWVPRLASTFFMDGTPREIPSPSHKARVGLFVGCAIHYLAPEIGEAAVGLLNRLGYTVVIPQGQGCCGLMAHGMGDEEAARTLAARTMQAFQDQDLEAIVAPCASCAAHLKEGYPKVFSGSVDDLVEAAEGFSVRVFELSEFLVQKGLPEVMAERKGAAATRIITYHDPCHLSRYLAIREEPRRLLRALQTWSFREMEGADCCCGMGGTFRLTHPGISRKILGEKMQAILESGADLVVTGCMGCWIQLREGVHASGMETKVQHLAEVLWGEVKQPGQEDHP
jgi:glycolate oxidase iron-sulfur subunit